MRNSILITGTDTGVGKTFVAAGLIKAMKQKGLDVCPLKPVESGCRTRKGKLVPADTVALIKASGIDEEVDLINPYRFKYPLAPSVAAEIEGVKINKQKMLSAYHKLSRKYDLIIVEGAGGIMTPVYKKYLIIDFAKALNLGTIIISRPGLGTINHTLLTIEAAKSRGVKVLGVIINYTDKVKKGISERTNPDVIENLGKVPVLGIVPYSIKQEAILNVFEAIVDKINLM